MVALVQTPSALQSGDVAIVNRGGTPAGVVLKDGAAKAVGTASTDLAAGNRGLPAGGAVGQVPIKQSSAEGDVAWGDSNLGLVIGVDVQAYSAVLAALADGTLLRTASASGPAALMLAEDTDNGANVVALQAPASLAANVTVTLPKATGTVLSTAEAATLSKGFSALEYDAGTVSTGAFAPDPANGNFQRYVNGGAHTLSPPGSTTAITVQMTNSGSAGAIATSGFTVVSGAPLTTADGDRFFLDVRRCNGVSHLHVTALQ